VLPIRKILHPTDLSDQAYVALDFACALAKCFDAELVICHIAPPPTVTTAEGMIITVPTGEENEQISARLKGVVPGASGIRTSHLLLYGDPVDEIVELAGNTKADLIVMETHGRGGLGRLLLGSVAEGVMRKAPCPVLTVKAPISIDHAATTAGLPSNCWND
jgi:nucleotide-binding universal stress UspA family protein